MKYPQINPIRFRVRSNFGSFDTEQITVDQYEIGSTVYDGVYPVNFAPLFVAGSTVKFQFSSPIDDIGEFSCKLHKDGVLLSSPTITDITPSAWTGDSFYKVEQLMVTSGCYYFTVYESINDKIAISDNIQIGAIGTEYVKIIYQNTENDYGAVFFDSATEKFEGLVYLPGQLIDFDPAQDISSYESDRGEIQKLQSTPVINYELKLYNINIAYSKMVNLIFSCDTITINGQSFDNAEGISVERIEDTDLCNITVKVRQKDYDYNYDQ